ncbi:MAG: hypothetical protein GY738_17415 [Pseudoalteromonas sp.]|nr:hypothetical protein [Pseudoalteromonas sp.]
MKQLKHNEQKNANINYGSLTDILRILSMLEKAFDRLVRLNYNHRSQYPELIIEIESTLAMLRSWINNYGIFSGTDAFNKAVELWVETVGMLIADLITECTPANGKKRVKKSRLIYQQDNLPRQS